MPETPTSSQEKPGQDPDQPLGVHQLSTIVGNYIARLGTVWVEGQVSQINVRKGMSYLKMRDVDRDETLSLKIVTSILEGIDPEIEQGSRIVAQLKPEWWQVRGTLDFKVLQLRAVGVGELMVRLEALRTLLKAEGLFDPARKKEIPFLPRRVGLITGRNGDAEHDVVNNARRRWPDVVFEIRNVSVEGPNAVREVTNALTELDVIDDIDVIVIARGGGNFEALLPFSDESLLRAVAQATTPVVAAIGHEEDHPLIDDVADFRASTPTDAARKIVPDVLQELANLRNVRTRNRQLVTARLDGLTNTLHLLRNRPALANPSALIDARAKDNDQLRRMIFSNITNKLNVESSDIRGLSATLRALSPQGTLERGFAIVRDDAGQVVRALRNAPGGTQLRVRVSDGEFSATAD